jgi:hypothetical protein
MPAYILIFNRKDQVQLISPIPIPQLHYLFLTRQCIKSASTCASEPNQLNARDAIDQIPKFL